MQNTLTQRAGQGLFARASRGAAIIATGFLGAQALRLLGNLVLTWLLYPEAFGLMALVQMVSIGLMMFSDLGIGPAISASDKGDDPDFLDTAWSLQLLRGGLLWVATCVLAWPISALYDAPELVWLLPATGLSLILAGLLPTRIETANRHLAPGRVIGLDVCAQAIGIGAMVVLALVTQSVWALVIGNLISAGAKLALMRAYLPGHRDRFRLSRPHCRELLRYGGWIFLSTICGFALMQGDKAILGKVLSLEQLGIYNVGYFLAAFPMLLCAAVVGRVFIPVYREAALAQDAHVYARLKRLRFGLSGAVFGLLAVMALTGPLLVEILYDSRYKTAGAIMVAIACVSLPSLAVTTYDQAALAAGDGRGFFQLTALKAGLQTLAFLIGALSAGLAGALLGQGLAALVTAPFCMALARKHHVWDPWHDALVLGLSALLTLCAWGLWHSELQGLLAF